jgi:hypothetical protein
MRTYRGVQIQLSVFLISSLGDEWSASNPSHFTCLIGVWMGPKYSLDAAKREKNMPLQGIEPWLSGIWLFSW